MGWWTSLKTDAAKLRCLTAAEVGTLLEAALLLPLTALAFRALGFRRWLTTLARFCPSGVERGRPSDLVRARNAARLVGAAAARLAPADSCLSQAVVLWWLLRRQGLDGEVRLGVRKQAGRLQAHAWIEYRGLTLGSAVGSFEPFPRPVVPCGGRAA